MGTIPSIFTENLRLATPNISPSTIKDSGFKTHVAYGNEFVKSGAKTANQPINERILYGQTANEITDKEKPCFDMSPAKIKLDMTKAFDTEPQVKTAIDNKDKDTLFKQTYKNNTFFDRNRQKHIVPEIRVETEQDRKQVLSLNP